MSAPTRRRTGLAAFAAISVIVALVLAGVLSNFASGSPDGLERVAEEQGLAEQAGDHALADSPIADYSLRGVGDGALAAGAAGALGVLATLAIGSGVAVALQRARRPGRPAAPAGAGAAD